MYKKGQIYALLSVLLLYLFFIQKLYADSPATPEPDVENFANLKINEVSFKNTEHDWIELYVTNSGTIKGLKVYDDTNFINMEDNITVNKGDYILIYFKAEEDGIGYNNGILVIQDTKSGLTGTTEQIAIKNNNNEVIDLICWRNQNPTSGEINEFRNLSIGNWTSDDISSCIDSDKVSSSDSIGRNTVTDTDSSEEWQIFSHPSPGEINEIEEIVSMPEIEIPTLVIEQNSEEESDTNYIEISEQNICTKDIVINEILPNPPGNDTKQEWIELLNIGSSSCFLEGWSIDDAADGSSPYFFKKNDEIISNGYFLVPSWITKINLNNSEDSVRLYKNDGNLVDEISYKNASEDETFSRIENEFFWTKKTTPLTENILIEELQADDKIKIIKKENENMKIPDGDLSDSVKINEIFPNPEGIDKGGEWIEIYNDSDETINLSNWILDTGENSKTKYSFQNFSIGTREHLLINDSEFNFSLKNSNGEVRLLDFNEDLQDQIDYGQAVQGKSYTKITIKKDEDIEEFWEWTEIVTPGEQNPIKNRLTGEIIEFDETKSVLSVKLQNSEDKLDLNVLNDGVSNFKNVFLKGAQISAITSEAEDGMILLDEYEITAPAKNESGSNDNQYLFYLLPILVLLSAFVYYINKKYKIIKFAEV
jgi:hypothetical protein